MNGRIPISRVQQGRMETVRHFHVIQDAQARHFLWLVGFEKKLRLRTAVIIALLCQIWVGIATLLYLWVYTPTRRQETP